jgi:DNA-binding beta-propeller fold protein YncE
VRLDYFKFNYRDKLAPIYKTQTERSEYAKLNFIYSQNNNLQFFVKSGVGFHSNDARVVVQNNGKQVFLPL